MKNGRDSLSRRELNAREMKGKIFNTAIMLFSRHGYDKVKIDDIIKYAGVSKGTFYAYFPSKDSVLVELFHRIDAHYLQVFKTVSPNETARSRLFIFMNAVAEYCTSVCGMQVMKVVYMDQISLHDRPPIINNKDRLFYVIMRETVRIGKQSGEFPTDIEDDELVEFLTRATRSVLYDWCLYDGVYDLRELGERHFTFLADLLAARAAQVRNAQTNEVQGTAQANETQGAV